MLALARATNDWQVAEWLDRDPRLRASIMLAPEDPVAAVSRWCSRCAAARVTSLTGSASFQVSLLRCSRAATRSRWAEARRCAPCGASYWPIYEACAEEIRAARGSVPTRSAPTDIILASRASCGTGVQEDEESPHRAFHCRAARTRLLVRCCNARQPTADTYHRATTDHLTESRPGGAQANVTSLVVEGVLRQDSTVSASS